jgi:hypothetical protein
MSWFSKTPPEGDFAAQIERLMATQVQAQKQAQAQAQAQNQAQAQAQAQAAPGEVRFDALMTGAGTMAEPGAQSGAEPGAQYGSEPGAQSGAESSAPSGSEPGAQPVVEMPLLKTLRAAATGISFVGHVKWLLLAVVATQVLGEFEPNAGFLLVPILLAYGGWVAFRVNRHSSGLLAARARLLAHHALVEAQHALEEAKKQSARFHKK